VRAVGCSGPVVLVFPLPEQAEVVSGQEMRTRFAWSRQRKAGTKNNMKTIALKKAWATMPAASLPVR
jgi:hypothetical protein